MSPRSVFEGRKGHGYDSDWIDTLCTPEDHAWRKEAILFINQTSQASKLVLIPLIPDKELREIELAIDGNGKGIYRRAKRCSSRFSRAIGMFVCGRCSKPLKGVCFTAEDIERYRGGGYQHGLPYARCPKARHSSLLVGPFHFICTGPGKRNGQRPSLSSRSRWQRQICCYNLLPSRTVYKPQHGLLKTHIVSSTSMPRSH